jgi:two-component system chemotaxis sensor kinase CheA
VTDDGRGLSRDRIAAKAVERGLIDDASGLSDDEIFRLVFLPGFSTAEKVTDLSGRGVGMDVVRRNIESLRGTVSLASQPGRGSTVQIRLPLTLAIIDGFRVAVAGHTFIVPLEAVVECIETPPEAVQLDVESGRACFPLRGEVLPLLCLRQQLHLKGPPASRRSVVVMRAGPRKVGVVVDRLLGEHQTVIKPLGRLFAPLRGISGSTILGTGAVALILDIAELAQAASRPARARRASAPNRSDPFAKATAVATTTLH